MPKKVDKKKNDSAEKVVKESTKSGEEKDQHKPNAAFELDERKRLRTAFTDRIDKTGSDL